MGQPWGDSMPSIKNYRAIDWPRLESIARQAGFEVGASTSSEIEVGFDVKAVKAKRKSERTRPGLSVGDPLLIDTAIEVLRDNGQLHVNRPSQFGGLLGMTGIYVWEQTKVTPVRLDVSKYLDLEGASKYLTVWISDPNRADGEEDSFLVGDSFLFLIEELASADEGDTMPLVFYSGLSALRYIVEIVVPAYAEVKGERPEGDDPYGEDDPRHPVDKLVAIGGKKGPARWIETVYKVAYMSDEQSIIVDGEHRRTNDLLAYPLYIAD